jgi:uncharacterized protein
MQLLLVRTAQAQQPITGAGMIAFQQCIRITQLFLMTLVLTFFQLATVLSAAEKTPEIRLITDSVTSSAFAQVRNIRSAIEKPLASKIVLRTDISSKSRILSLIANKADYCFCGSGTYLAQEGLLGYEKAELGPLPLRVILSSSGDFQVNLAIAKERSIPDLTALAGKRVAWLRKQGNINVLTTSLLAFGNMGWQNVHKITFPTYKAALEGFQKGLVDALPVFTNTPTFQTLVAGKRQFFFPDLKRKDFTAWRRLQNLSPYLTPAPKIKTANQKEKWAGATHPYPVLMTTADKDTNAVYALTKAMAENFDQFAGNAEGAEGWNILFQNFTGPLPFHDGAIKYFKELGIWDEKADQHQTSLIARQQKLKEAFEAYKATNPSNKNFALGWRTAREQAFSETVLKN